ncbi:class I SAM-dependent methyltransferase [Pseudovibrio sp. Tun.PSC04-5.I4]|uniref:class I SAM-dependent methyltransferase n=1 Tax=Pseudovibrio sp. Tun.PSC04-5.I4 TaxID=1798213 RepID=UPI00088180C3|nr:class I SAM-dependent methyltransferase [Pseudovibrio sp. Tun.PSC04-5.I4]SDQ86805.1 16S rRNA m(2)G 1207 methyltransferase [Pseudovibrio sp. Tun.PSC04-5.I4]
MIDSALDTLLLPFEEGNLDFFKDAKPEDKALFLRARMGFAMNGIDKDRLVCEQTFAPDRDNLERAGFNVAPQVEGQYPLVLLLPPRQRDEARAQMAKAVKSALNGGIVVASVSNTEGAKTAQSDLTKLAGNAGKISKNKCRVFWSEITPETVDHELVEEWSKLDAPREIMEGEFISRPGVFAWDHLDRASQLLVSVLPEKLAGRGADLGCGFGYLSREVAKREKVKGIDLYDAEKRALDLAEQNLKGKTGDVELDFFWQDATTKLARTYDFVFTNPPFHAGGKQDRVDIGQEFIKSAARSLRPSGHLWLVANRHLPYEETLSKVFASFEIMASQNGYKVIRAIKANK